MTKNHSPESDESHSLWMDIKAKTFPPLKSNIECDVAIVGAGIAGLTSAYTLAKQGKRVVVIDKGDFFSGQTCRTTAHLTWLLDKRFSAIEKKFGFDQAKLAALSHNAALDYIEKIVDLEKIDCDFERVNGALISSPSTKDEEIEKEYHLLKKMGFSTTLTQEFHLNPHYGANLALIVPDQAKFHIIKYINGLAKVITDLGGKIYHHTLVEKIQPNLLITSNNYEVKSESTIVTTCTPVNDRFYMHTKQGAYRTYVIAAKIPKNEIFNGLIWDTEDPYHYIRTQEDETDKKFVWAIIGGEDHKTGQADHLEERYVKLEEWARQLFPKLGEVEYRWSGQVYEPIDTLAFIGRNPHDKDIYIATGTSGNGITYGTIAGMLLPDLILGIENSWQELYEPSRKKISALPEFIEESSNIMWQYRDWFTPGENETIEQLGRGEGIVLRQGVKKLAVYKDEKDHLHVNSAFCPHLGGCVRWNSAEKSWDCPCHGSRFDGEGNVLTGPSSQGLCPCKLE